MNTNATSALIWSVADILRGDFRPSVYGSMILPFIVLRRLDNVLEKTKEAVLVEYQKNKELPTEALDSFLTRKSGYQFYNTSPMTFQALIGDPANIHSNISNYISSFSGNVRDVFERFNFQAHINLLNDANLLYLVVQKFSAIDMHPDVVSNAHMGAIFEELIRKFAELSNETAGEHFTPREVIRLMVDLLFIADSSALSSTGVVRKIYDPTAGTGGMLSVAEEYLSKHNPDSRLVLHGQELNAESYATCKADMLIKGQDISNIVFGNTLSNDGLTGKTFDYMLSNPPFGVEWKKIESVIRKEYEQKGFEGRFGPGLPRVSDGSLLFLLHLISKMRPMEEGGSRIGIVLNGSPLFTGSAGSGESEIRKWIIENDLLETLVALPTDMFYNTGISTYIWILSNHKSADRKGKIQLINAVDMFQKLRKSLGSKRKELGKGDIKRIVELYGNFEETEHSKIFNNQDFGYSTVTVERSLKDDDGNDIIPDKGKFKGKRQPDPLLRDTENIPLNEDIEEYFNREVLSHIPDAWIDHDKTRVGYEITFNKYFYKFSPLRSLNVIDAEIKSLSEEITISLNIDSSMKINPYLAYKDSGVKWLDNVPQEWNVKPLKLISDLRLSNIDKHTVPTEPAVKLCNYVDVYKNENIDSSIDFMKATASVDQIKRLTLAVGDVIITKDSENANDIGVPAYVKEIQPGLVCGYHLALIRPNAEVSGEFLNYLFKSKYTASYFENEASGMTRYAIGKYSIENLDVPTPEYDEQVSIANFLNYETSKLDDLVAKQQKLIELLKEKRKAIISAAVTGKIDVRGVKYGN